MEKRFAVSLIILVVLILIAGNIFIFSKLSSPTGKTIYEQPKLKVASHTTMLGIVLEIAEEKGFYDEEGIDVEVKQVKSSKESMPALANGNLDIVIGSISAGSFNHLIKNKDLRIIADGARVVPTIVVRKDLADEIKDIKDLEGRVFITPREGSASYYALIRILQSKGLDINDVISKYLKQNEAISAFETKQVEAGILNEPFATSLVKSGIAVKFDSSRIEPIFPKNGQQHMILFTTTRTLKNKETIKKFLKAYQNSAEFYNKAFEGNEPERSEVVRIASKVYGTDPSILKKSRWIAISSDITVDINYLNKAQEYYLDKGLIDQKVNLNEKIESRFLP